MIVIVTAYLAGRGDIMSRIADRLLARVAPKVSVAAGCSYYTHCSGGVKYNRVCCLDEGCTEVKIGTC